MRAVAFIIFDRPELTKRLFEKIRSAKSAILLGSGFGFSPALLQLARHSQIRSAERP